MSHLSVHFGSACAWLKAPGRAIKAMAINATLIRKFVIVLAPLLVQASKRYWTKLAFSSELRSSCCHNYTPIPVTRALKGCDKLASRRSAYFHCRTANIAIASPCCHRRHASLALNEGAVGCAMGAATGRKRRALPACNAMTGMKRRAFEVVGRGAVAHGTDRETRSGRADAFSAGNACRGGSGDQWI